MTEAKPKQKPKERRKAAELTLWSKYYLVPEAGSFSIRRYRKVKSKTVWNRYPRKKYKDLPKNELIALVRKLNVTRELEEQKAIERYDFDNSFITVGLRKSFNDELKKHSTNLNHRRAMSAYLHKYALYYFINVAKMPDPNNWEKKEGAWGEWLQKQELSVSVLNKIVQATNRFLKMLHKKNSVDYPLIKLEPLGRAVKKTLKSKEEKIGKYISDEDWKIIEDNITPELKSVTQLGYFYGLRRAETLAITQQNLFDDMLSVEKQLVKLKPIVYLDTLKNKEKREVPNWFLQPDEAYEIISNIVVMHPTTLSHLFKAEMKRLMKDCDLKQAYNFHDLRRTFITRALRVHHYRDCQLAAGHSDLRTTMLYAMDDRKKSRTPFVPPSKIKAV